MSPLHDSLSDYLRIRRALGYKLLGTERCLGSYLEYLKQTGEQVISIENAVSFARLSPAPGSWSRRLGQVRCFARYMHVLDPAHQVPPRDLLPVLKRRTVPYLYARQEIVAIMDVAASLSNPLQAATFRTLIGLLAVTGMRSGEAIGLDIEDLDLDAGLLLIREGKFGKSRLLPLHRSTLAALQAYRRLRCAYRPDREPQALFITMTGRRISRGYFSNMFRSLAESAGVRARSQHCKPRAHDLRHSFAVATLLDWYRDGVEVAPRMPLLSTYLGHAHPKHTYWYLHAAPELLTLAAERLENNDGGAR